MANGEPGKGWNTLWEKVLSVLLTLNIAVMGWLWASVARLAGRIDRHVADRAIHQDIQLDALVGRREYETQKDHERTGAQALLSRFDRLEGKMDRFIEGRGKDET